MFTAFAASIRFGDMEDALYTPCSHNTTLKGVRFKKKKPSLNLYETAGMEFCESMPLRRSNDPCLKSKPRTCRTILSAKVLTLKSPGI